MLGEREKEGLYLIWIAAGQGENIGLPINDAIPEDDGTLVRSHYFELLPGNRDIYNELLALGQVMTGEDEVSQPVRVVQDKLIFYELEAALIAYWDAVAEFDLQKLECEHQMQIQLANGTIAGKNDDDRWGAYWQANEDDMRKLEEAQTNKGLARTGVEVCKMKLRMLGYMQEAERAETNDTWDIESESYSDDPKAAG